MRPSDGDREEPFFSHIAVAGLGLIGGSVVKALRLKGYRGRITGIDANPQTRSLAAASGLFSRVMAVEEEGEAADILILAVPPAQMAGTMAAVGSLIGEHTVVTDTGSVKQAVHEAAERALPAGTAFVGGHPMAGSEQSGFANASPILFENAYHFLTPGPDSSQEHLATLQRLVRRLGAIPVVTTPEQHDAMAAGISHLPHVAACALVSAFEKTLPEGCLRYAGGGFRDTTRIALGDPELWQDILLRNRAPLIAGIDGLIRELHTFREQLAEAKSEEIGYNLTRIKTFRSKLAACRPKAEASLYPMGVALEDRPGTLAAVVGLLADHQLNIKDMVLEHVRETAPGALVLSFATPGERLRAAQIIQEAKLCDVFIEQD